MAVIPNMAKNSLPPGFRFHPTDVELIMYYLKRKVTGKKLRAEAIAEVNIYKFSPWDLPDMSSLKSKDLEWFFFCPREKKYASGVRVKRATENGYWKTTGKDRHISYGDKIVGSVKTLVFHIGHAPQGERTDWVIHEYMIIDAQLAAAGLEDIYVLCKVFKKNGPGPKVGAQYGAPFNEEDWSDDDVGVSEIHAAPSIPDVRPSTALTPEKQCCVSTGSLIPESTSGSLLTKKCLNVNQTSATPDSFHPGSTSGLSLVKSPQPPAGPIASELLDKEFDDDIARFLASFTDDDIDRLLLDTGHHEDDLIGTRPNMSVPSLDEFGTGLQDLNNIFAPIDQSGFDLPGMPKANYSGSFDMVMQNESDYIELNDLLPPLNGSTETFGNDQSYDMVVSIHGNVPQFYFSGTDHSASCIDQLPMMSNQSNNGDSGLEFGQVSQLHSGSNAVYDHFTYGPPSNGRSVGFPFNEDIFGSRR